MKNKWFYIASTIISLLSIIVGSIITSNFNIIFTSIGCSLLASVIVAAFIEIISEKEKAALKQAGKTFILMSSTVN